jgi:PAS domain S-box-containing protein
MEMSPETADVLGVSSDALTGLTNVAYVERFVHPDDRARVIGQTEVRLGNSSRYDTEYRLVPRGKEIRWIREVGDAILSEAGELIEEVGTIQDITALKQQEEALIRAQKMEAVGQLTGGIAHDFNNLLAVVQGNLELLDDILEGQDGARELVRNAFDAARRGATLTHRLLAFSRRQPLRPGPTDVNEVMADTATGASSKARSSTSPSTAATPCRTAGG